MMRQFLTIGLVVSLAQFAYGDIVISEWMYSGNDGEFIEFTNTGLISVDMTGWSYDDDSQVPGTVSLSAFGIMAPGESVLLTEVPAADFAAAWGLTGVTIIGDNAANLGRNDQINLYNASGVLVAQLSYGDQTYPGTVRTQNASCNLPLAYYGSTVVDAGWVLATASDSYDSWASENGDLGSPGTAPVPEVTAASLVLGQLCGLGLMQSAVVISLGLMLMRSGSRRYA